VIVKESRRPKKVIEPYVLIAPAVIYLFLFFVFPLIFSLKKSFYSFNFVKPTEQRFIGFANYLFQLRDDWFHNAVIVTIFLTVVSVLLTFIIGLGLALLVDRVPFGRNVLTLAFILPMTMSSAVAGRVWRAIFEYSGGLANQILNYIGLNPIPWLSNGVFAKLSIVIVDVWQWFPFAFLILLAGLQSIPIEPFEAAKVDGATSFQVFRYITLPLLKPIILLVLLFRTVDTFRLFDVVYVLTKGGPGIDTETLSLLTYRWGYLMLEIGRSSALSFLILIIVTIPIMIVFRKSSIFR
jgi:multiple sugar transport system permease protein